MSGARAARPADDDKEQDKGRVAATKVKRYWPGKAPDWVEGDAAAAGEALRTDIAAPVIVKRTDDPRLARLQQSRGVDREEAIQRHREIRAAEIVRRVRVRDEDEAAAKEESEASEEEEEEEEAQEQEEDEEELQRRRQAVRERLLQQQRQQEELLAQQQQDDEYEEEEESEYETDSEDEGPGRRLLKPMFIPKTDRETIAEAEALEKEEEEARLAVQQRAEERRLETQQIVKQIADQEAAIEAAAKARPQDEAEIDTDDEGHMDEDFEAWRMRELGRIRRDREEREQQEREAQERERLKNMTEEERRAWDAANPKQQPDKLKKKWKFMQKYWHKGAFFQEEADDKRGTAGPEQIYGRDFSAPTGEDVFDKSILPKVMQVRNFGRSGRTKWTHLVAEDTTNFESDYIRDEQGKLKSFKRPGSSTEEFSKPKKFKM